MPFTAWKNADPRMDPSPTPEQDSPPILGTWTKMYLFVLVLHALIIFLFYLFTHAYA